MQILYLTIMIYFYIIVNVIIIIIFIYYIKYGYPSKKFFHLYHQLK